MVLGLTPLIVTLSEAKGRSQVQVPRTYPAIRFCTSSITGTGSGA
jgi:hypothetical protein